MDIGQVVGVFFLGTVFGLFLAAHGVTWEEK